MKTLERFRVLSLCGDESSYKSITLSSSSSQEEGEEGEKRGIWTKRKGEKEGGE